MRLLYVVPFFLPESIGGLELHTFRLAQEISKSHEIKVFCRGSNLSKDDYSTEDVIYEGIEIRRINYVMRDVKGFSKYCIMTFVVFCLITLVFKVHLFFKSAHT